MIYNIKYILKTVEFNNDCNRLLNDIEEILIKYTRNDDIHLRINELLSGSYYEYTEKRGSSSHMKIIIDSDKINTEKWGLCLHDIFDLSKIYSSIKFNYDVTKYSLEITYYGE